MRLTPFILVLGIGLFIGGFIYVPPPSQYSYTNTIIVNAAAPEDYNYVVTHSAGFYVSFTGAFIVVVAFVRIYRNNSDLEVAPAPLIKKPNKLESV